MKKLRTTVVGSLLVILAARALGALIPMSISLGVPVPAPPTALHGLDWDGTAPGLRMLYWHSVPDLYPWTVFAKTYLRTNQTITRTDGSRYGTFFFWGNDGDGVWDMSSNNSYWGIEPYPSIDGHSPPSGPWRFEIAVWNRDYVDRMDGSSPIPTYDQWYSMALVATATGCPTDATKSNHTAWINLPSTSTANKIHAEPCFQQSPADWGQEPPQRAMFFGQSPQHPSFPLLSWGGYYGYDECNCVIRGIQMYTVALSEAQVVSLSACDTDACVLAALAGQGISGSALWYLNMNPTPTDVTDKSGNGHHGSWNHATNRPTLWTG